MKKIKECIHNSIVMRAVIGILFIVLVGIIWGWSLEICSTRQPDIQTLYEIEAQDSDD